MQETVLTLDQHIPSAEVGGVDEWNPVDAPTVLPTLPPPAPVFALEQGLPPLQTVSAEWFATPKADCWWAGLVCGCDHPDSGRWGWRLVVEGNGESHCGSA